MAGWYSSEPGISVISDENSYIAMTVKSNAKIGVYGCLPTPYISLVDACIDPGRRKDKPFWFAEDQYVSREKCCQYTGTQRGG